MKSKKMKINNIINSRILKNFKLNLIHHEVLIDITLIYGDYFEKDQKISYSLKYQIKILNK